MKRFLNKKLLGLTLMGILALTLLAIPTLKATITHPGFKVEVVWEPGSDEESTNTLNVNLGQTLIVGLQDSLSFWYGGVHQQRAIETDTDPNNNIIRIITGSQIIIVKDSFGNPIGEFPANSVVIMKNGAWFEFAADHTEAHVWTPTVNGVGLFEIDIRNWGINSVIGTYLTFETAATDSTRPAISGQENFATNIEDNRPLEWFLKNIHAIDDVDGAISDKIVVETDNYTPNRQKVGRFNVILSVTDNAGNKSTFEFFINVLDINAPIITGVLTSTICYTGSFDIESYRLGLSVSDNVDTLSSQDIIIANDQYTQAIAATNPIARLGTWTIDFQVKDKSGNVGTLTKAVNIVDQVKPYFEGNQTVQTNVHNHLNINDLKNMLIAFDEIDGDLTSRIKVVHDTFTNNNQKPGVYYATFAVTDNSNNTANHTIKITIIDDWAPVWYITDQNTINLAPGMELSQTALINLLTTSGFIEIPNEAVVEVVSNEYVGNHNTPGIYSVTLLVKEAHQETNYHFYVNVLGEFNDWQTEVPILNTGSNVNVVALIVLGALSTVLLVALGTKWFIKARKNKILVNKK